MSEQPDKINLALKEIGHGRIEVIIADGKLIKICKGRYPCPEKHGVIKEIEIREDITL
jgi:hypothetical protein